MAAASSGRAEVDTSRAFRSVKEAVAVFGERILARETQIQFRRSAVAPRGDPVSNREKNFSKSPNSIAISAPKAKLDDFSDGVPASGVLTMENHHHSRANGSYDVKKGGLISNNQSARNSLPVVPQVTSRQTPDDDVPMYLEASLLPLFASSPSPATDYEYYEEQQHRKEEAADLVVLSTVKRLEEEAARTRQEAAQLKKRIAEMELSVATLNAKLHRALSKLAHMEADRAAAERARIVERGDVALALWAERGNSSRRPPLGRLMRFGDGPDDDGEERAMDGGGGGQELARTPVRRTVRKRKPIVPLVFPLISGLLFSNRKRVKDQESVYVKELYSLLRLS